MEPRPMLNLTQIFLVKIRHFTPFLEFQSCMSCLFASTDSITSPYTASQYHGGRNLPLGYNDPGAHFTNMD